MSQYGTLAGMLLLGDLKPLPFRCIHRSFVNYGGKSLLPHHMHICALVRHVLAIRGCKTYIFLMWSSHAYGLRGRGGHVKLYAVLRLCQRGVGRHFRRECRHRSGVLLHGCSMLMGPLGTNVGLWQTTLLLAKCTHSNVSCTQALTGHHVGPTTAATSLEEMFSSGGRAGTSKRVTVLLVDEMDLLVTKKQTVITWNA